MTASVSLEGLWCLALVVAIWVFVNTQPIRPQDFWWHIQAGRELLHSGQIPSGQGLAFTVPDRPYPNYAAYWVMDALLYLIYASGGPAAVIFAHSLMVTAAYALMLLICYQASQSWRMAAAATAFAAALGFNDWNVRPQAIAFPLAAICIYALYQAQRTSRLRWLLAFPPALVVWTNSHSTFGLGLVLLGMWLLDRAWATLRAKAPEERRSAGRMLAGGTAALVASGIACAANPRGFGFVSYLTSMGANPIVQNLVVEWAPPAFNSALGTLFFGGFLLSAVVMAASPQRPTPFQLLSFLGFAGLAFKTSRGIVWFGLVMAPILAEHLAATWIQFMAPGDQNTASDGQARRERPRVRRRTRMNLAIAGIFVLVGVLSLPWFKHVLPLPPSKVPLISEETPVAAIEFLLREQPPGHLFHEQSFGSYLIWAAQPDYPVFVDPRIELYPAELWLDYLGIAGARCDWQDRLDHYGVNTLMLSPVEQTGLITAVMASRSWQIAYQDESAVIFTRVGSIDR